MWRLGMKFLKKLIILSSIVLAGCASKPPVLLPEEQKVEINSSIMADCGVLLADLPKGSSFEDTLIAHAEDAKTFAKCKELNNSKKEVIQRFLLNERQKQADPKPKEQTRRVGIFG
jgi:uncharacterized protein YcfL